MFLTKFVGIICRMRILQAFSQLHLCAFGNVLVCVYLYEIECTGTHASSSDDNTIII